MKFETVKIESTTKLKIDGMEISAYIAGVNSGVYGLPYVIEVRTWARKWFFNKFFYRKMKLNIHDVTHLRDECNKVIEYYNQTK